ncbi:MAG: ABC transporter substrate-binding protein [Tistlia sp.]|uniref:ABC transporter substrate-binding protein n=1 Tax=Tistlia sp. TaxID=3057121 RepID=UPI0034A3899E
MNRTLAVLLGGALALGLVQAGTAQADELVIGVGSEPSAIDPHYHNLGPNNALKEHIFDGLIKQDAQQRLQPGLAESWEPLDDTTWQFNLRQGVTFHDGTPFDAEDVIYTIERVPNVPNSPSSFGIYTNAIESMEAKDPHTLIFKTPGPRPLLPTELSNIAIISKETVADSNGGDWPKTEGFNDGSLAVGTGPYKFKEFVKGDRLVLTANADYWGGAPEWEQVTFKPITSDGPRVAALLSGDVDVIDNPPTQDLPRLESDPEVSVYSGLSNRVIYLHMDQHADETPGVKGTDGKNPFKDVRVREAVSKAIDRKAIVEKIMGGVAVAAEQLLPQGMYGASMDLSVEEYDPEAAKALLAEAGYPDGFELVIGTPNDRYINDEKVAQAAAQFLSRVGIKTGVDASTKSVFFKRRNDFEFTVYLAGWGAGTGEMSSPLRALVATPDKDKGYGGTNRGRYSNPELDAKIEEALATLDDAEREKLLQEASELVVKDYGILPLHYEVTSWATRKGLAYEPRADQYTMAMSVTKAD